MTDATPIFSSRSSDIEALHAHWTRAVAGAPEILRLVSPFGGGRRALVIDFYEALGNSDRPVYWHVGCIDSEDGQQWLIRMYGALIGSLLTNASDRQRVEAHLQSRMPALPERLQNWVEQFLQNLKNSSLETATGQVHLQFPVENPLLGLVEVALCIAEQVPLLLELQNPQSTHSVALARFVEALWNEGRQRSAKVLLILHDHPASELRETLFPAPLLELYARHEEAIKSHTIAPWTEVETAQHLHSRALEADAGSLTSLGGGKPGFIIEAIEICQERALLGQALQGFDVSKLLPPIPAPVLSEAREGERDHAASNPEQALFFAALLGQEFPLELVADMASFTRESTKALFDAMGDWVQPSEYSESLGAWIYTFTRGTWREAILANHQTEEGRELARKAGTFLDSTVSGLGFGFQPKIARILAENGAIEHAQRLIARALGNDPSDILAFVYELGKAYASLHWPLEIWRDLYKANIENLVQQQGVELLQLILAEAYSWAETHQEAHFNAWLSLQSSQLASMLGQSVEASSRAANALQGFEQLQDEPGQAESLLQLAALAVGQDQLQQAVAYTTRALPLLPPEPHSVHLLSLKARAEMVFGLVARTGQDFATAATHYGNAQQIAVAARNTQMVLSGGLSLAETHLASGDPQQALGMFAELADLAQRTGSALHERNACELAGTASAGLQQWEQAAEYASRTLALTRLLGMSDALPMDLYNQAFFLLASEKITESLPFFNEALPLLSGAGTHPVVKECLYFAAIAYLQSGEATQASRLFLQALTPIEQHQDWQKYIIALSTLGTLAQQAGNLTDARQYIERAYGRASLLNLETEAAELRAQLAAL